MNNYTINNNIFLYTWEIYFSYNRDINGARAYTRINSSHGSINNDLLKEINLLLDRTTNYANYQVLQISLLN